MVSKTSTLIHPLPPLLCSDPVMPHLWISSGIVHLFDTSFQEQELERWCHGEEHLLLLQKSQTTLMHRK